MKIKSSTNFLFVVVFVFSIFLQLYLVALVPQIASAAAIDDAKKEACDNVGVTDKEVCEKLFVKGYKEAKRLNETDQKKVCISPDEPLSGTDRSWLKGCYEGVNFFRAQKGKSVPGGSDAVKNTPASEFCKDKNYKDKKLQNCIAGYIAGSSGEDKDKACKGKGDACKKGFEKGKEVSNDEGQGTESADCNADSGLSWIICPVVELGANFVNDFFENFLQPLLEDVPVSLDPNEGSFKAWQGFRVIANILLVTAMLAIVYAQARGEK